MILELKKTPLHQTHIEMDAQMGEFGGWHMPLYYPTRQLKEHQLTREAIGLFDTCHMGEFFIEGPESQAFLQSLITNDLEKLRDNRAQYNLMLNEKGGVVDDCVVYKFNNQKFMVVVNGGTSDTDFDWVYNHLKGDVHLTNRSKEYGKIDVQGPKSAQLLCQLIGQETTSQFTFFSFQDNISIAGVNCLISRTGYSGEMGFEIYCPADSTVDIWKHLLKEGESFGIVPAGLAARDTLRLEAGLPLHGHEFSEEALVPGDLWDFVINNPGDFIGKEALEKAKMNGKRPQVAAFQISGRRKCHPHADVIVNEEKIGHVVSVVISPSLGKVPIGFMITEETLRVDSTVELRDPEGKLPQMEATVADTPFVELTSRRKIADFLPGAE